MTDTRALRAEFEPLLISPYGCHLDAARCARGWDTSKESDEDLAEQIARADVWLQMMGPRRTPNRRISSYGLKHVVEGWHRERGTGGYVANGCFIMAAHRLGFTLERIQGSYCGAGWDCFNAFLNISHRSIRAARPATAHVAQGGRGEHLKMFACRNSARNQRASEHLKMFACGFRKRPSFKAFVHGEHWRTLANISEGMFANTHVPPL
jgi:hypothetical protein